MREADFPPILIYRDELLRTNETFIRNQVKAIRRHAVKYVGLESASSAEVADSLILLNKTKSFSSQIRSQLYRAVPISPAFHRRITKSSPTLVHAHFSQDATTILPFVKRLAVPLVVTLHGSFETVPTVKLIRGLRSLLYVLRRQALWQYASVFLCVSSFVREQAVKHGFPAAKLIVHRIGIDTEFFTPKQSERDANVVLFVGRLAEKKGCEYLIKAMKEVKSNNSSAKLVVLGDGELRISLQTLDSELGNQSTFLGEQNSDTILQWLRRARVFVAPSVTAASGDMEGLPTVICEAQSVGTPVVSTLHGGIPEVVKHQRTGVLVAERDVRALATNIHHLMTNDVLWEAYSENGRHLMQTEFNLLSQTTELERIYDSARANRGNAELDNP